MKSDNAVNIRALLKDHMDQILGINKLVRAGVIRKTFLTEDDIREIENSIIDVFYDHGVQCHVSIGHLLFKLTHDCMFVDEFDPFELLRQLQENSNG